MLSFELLLLVLIVVVIILLILYIVYALEPPAKPVAEKKKSAREKISTGKPATSATNQKARTKKPVPTKPQIDSLECSYGFGYLRKRDKKAPIPDECLGCSRILGCLGSSE